MAYLHHLSQDSIVVPAVSIISYNENDICCAKYIWQDFDDFIGFLWNMSPASATQNGILVNLYLPNWQENVVKYEDIFIKFRLW